MSKNINSKVKTATLWSAMAEVIAKLIAPITSMVLARLLTPDAFGVVATLHMIIAFADIFTDAGFQKYVIQHEFKDEADKDKSVNVAFWSNLILSLIIWGLIAIFNAPLAELVGSAGLGHVLIVACVAIPISSFSSIQMAVFKRSLNFKALFYRRLVAVLIPLLITIPLALLLKSYWALVFGNIASALSNAIILTLQSPWKPRLYYDFIRFKEMISFSIWTLFDSILIWTTSYLEVFFISTSLSSYHLGIYKTGTSTVTQFTTIVTTAVLPVILPALSRVQNDHDAMRQLLLKMQKYLAIILLPIGFGVFTFRNLVTDVMLGDQWGEAVELIGLWALVEVITVIFSRFCSNIYPAIGKPKISVTVQILHLVVLIPAVILSVSYGFRIMYWVRSLVRFELVLVNMIFAYITIKQTPWNMIKNLYPEFIACLIMTIVGTMLLVFNDSILMSFIWVAICAILYLGIIVTFKKERTIVIGIYDSYLKKNVLKIKNKFRK